MISATLRSEKSVPTKSAQPNYRNSQRSSISKEFFNKFLKHYKAFRRFRNFASMEIHPSGNEVVLFLKVHIESVNFDDGFVRDVREVGHYGTGNVQIRISNQADFERAKPVMILAYSAE